MGQFASSLFFQTYNHNKSSSYLQLVINRKKIIHIKNAGLKVHVKLKVLSENHSIFIVPACHTVAEFFFYSNEVHLVLYVYILTVELNNLYRLKYKWHIISKR